jgi:hypothetical protein
MGTVFEGLRGGEGEGRERGGRGEGEGRERGGRGRGEISEPQIPDYTNFAKNV